MHSYSTTRYDWGLHILNTELSSHQTVWPHSEQTIGSELETSGLNNTAGAYVLFVALVA